MATGEAPVNIAAIYSFNKGEEYINNNFGDNLKEVINIINSVDAQLCKDKISKEKTMPGKMLFNPVCMNKAFKEEFAKYGWANHKEYCEYNYGRYLDCYIPPKNQSNMKPFRDMDFIKPGVRLGIEVQFGKYAFMVYNVCAKMTIFHNLNIINAGIEIIPTKHLADEMSTGVSYFEQISWDLEKRGVADIDIPVLILGIDA